MSSDAPNNSPPNGSANRRGSVTSVAFSNLFQRSNSTSASSAQARELAAIAAARDQRRRLSVTTLGLSGTSPQSTTSPFGLRRGSISTTTSESIDESAVDDEEAAKPVPNTPYTRHLSFGAQAMRMRPSPTSPGTNGRHTSGASPRTPSTAGAAPAVATARGPSTSQASNAQPTRTPSDLRSARSDNAYNWSEQLRSRAESTVTGHRHGFGPRVSTSPPRGSAQHDRTKSVSDMPAPPQQAAAMKPKQPERPKPDHFQERILKGDFYMD